MEPVKDIAIVLRSVAFQERHRIVTALSENYGLISAMAKNSVQSRRFGGSLEVFTAAEWLFTLQPGAELIQLREAETRRSFEGLRKDFERLSMASAFNELIIRTAPHHQPSPELFRLHTNALATLEELPSQGAPIGLLNAYLAKLLQWSGNQPSLQSCKVCQTSLDQVPPDASLTCMIADAGWICPNCRVETTRHVERRHGDRFESGFVRLSPAALIDFHLSLALPIRQMLDAARASTEEHHKLFQFLEALVVFHLPGFDKKPLKSLRFLGLESSLPLREPSPQQNWPGLA
jgi:DNA repair protein RecO (recombination protein O)